VVQSGASVLVLDSISSKLSNLAIISDVRRKAPGVKVVLIDMDDDPDTFLECVRAGAVG
jgi:DNA-binding NarL/FixJ family response regulator